MNFSSKLVADAVEAFASLPGIGKKTALRLVLHMIKQSKDFTIDFVQPIVNLKEGLKTCSTCHNISDDDHCIICKDPRRDKHVLCIVEGIRDVMAIEETAQYRGQYHVLNGVISPIEGVGPEELNIASLVQRIEKGEIKEVIMAISPTIEGDTTIYYISKLLKPLNVSVSTIARGVSFGGELEYADEITLGRSIVARIPYDLNGD